MTDPLEPANEIDARGLKCPMPVVLLGRRMTKLAPGGVVTLTVDDPASRLDIPVWCARNGHFLHAEAEVEGEAAAWRFTIAAGAGAARTPDCSLP